VITLTLTDDYGTTILDLKLPSPMLTPGTAEENDTWDVGQLRLQSPYNSTDGDLIALPAGLLDQSPLVLFLRSSTALTEDMTRRLILYLILCLDNYQTRVRRP
jgi:hypothetical protein